MNNSDACEALLLAHLDAQIDALYERRDTLLPEERKVVEQEICALETQVLSHLVSKSERDRQEHVRLMGLVDRILERERP